MMRVNTDGREDIWKPFAGRYSMRIRMNRCGLFWLSLLFCLWIVLFRETYGYAYVLSGTDGENGFRRRLPKTEMGAVVPVDTEQRGEVFVPVRDGDGLMGIGMNGTNHRIHLEALWEDRGIKYLVLPIKKNLSEPEYCRRYGLSDGSLPEGMQYGGNICLSEPDGFESYLWESFDAENNTLVEIGSTSQDVAKRCIEISAPERDTKYHCWTTVTNRHGEVLRYCLGESYSVHIVRLPMISGIQIHNV